MRKRAALARAIALDPEILFLDEPTAGLDPLSAAGFDDLVRHLKQLLGPTIVIVSHDLDLLWRVADRVAFLAEGRVVGVGTMVELSQVGAPGGARVLRRPARSGGHGAVMETKVNLTVVGLFVLVLGAAGIAAVLWLGSGRLSQKQYGTYLAYFTESVSGLNLHAPVRSRGVAVGSVREISLDPANPERVRLVLEVEQGTPVKEDSVAILGVQGLTGLAYVELSGGTRGVARAPGRCRASRTRSSGPAPP